jgi:hypothetical protein
MEDGKKKGFLALTRVISIAYIRHRSILTGAFFEGGGAVVLDRTWQLNDVQRLKNGDGVLRWRKAVEAQAGNPTPHEVAKKVDPLARGCVELIYAYG